MGCEFRNPLLNSGWVVYQVRERNQTAELAQCIEKSTAPGTWPQPRQTA